MALSSSYSEFSPLYARTQFGEVPLDAQQVTISDVYIKVGSVLASKDSIVAKVSFTKDIKLAERSYSFPADLDGPNFIKQAYEYLKTLPEFSDAVDC